MTEKVVFEFRAINNKKGIKYEIKQGDKTYTCSGRKIFRCFPLALFLYRKNSVRIHRGFFRRSQKRIRESLNALESIYADFYRSEKATKVSNNHE